MLYKEDWDKAKERLTALWENEVIDRCCVAVAAPKDGALYKEEAPPNNEEDLFKYYMDKEWLLRRHLQKFENTFFGGEAFPCIWPNFGTAGHAKYFKGCKFHFGRDTVWYESFIQDWQKDTLEYDPNCSILNLEKATLKFLAEQGKGKFLVTMPDNCGVIDALAHLRGTDNLLFDLVDESEMVKKATGLIQKALIHSSVDLFTILRENNDNGSSHGWMYTWSKGRHLQMQVDFSVMISPQMFEEFALPELEATSSWLDNAVYHLDGQQEVRHLDMILSVKKLNMIQWTPVAGQPKTSEFIPVFKKIQKAGKGLVLIPSKNEIETLLSELSPKGLILVINDATSETEAKAIIKRVAELTKA
jgi:hypothetical protein